MSVIERWAAMPSSWDRLKEVTACTTVAAPAASSSSSSRRIFIAMSRPLARTTQSTRSLLTPGRTKPATRLTAMIARPRPSRPLRASISSRASARTTRNLIGVRLFAASESSLDTGRFFEETWPPKRPARGEVAGGAETALRSVIRPCDNPKEGKQGPPGNYSARAAWRGAGRRREAAGRGPGSRLTSELFGSAGTPGVDRQRLDELERDHRAFGDDDLLAGSLGGDGGGHRRPHQGADEPG